MAELTFTKIEEPKVTFTRQDEPSFAQGVGTGVLDKFYGAAQLGGHIAAVPEQPMAPNMGMVPAEATKAVDETVRQREKTLESEGYNKGWGRTVGNILGDVIETAPLAFIPGGAATGIGGRIAQGALRGAEGGLVAGATKPVAGDNYETAKLKQIGAETAAGAGVGAALAPLAKAISKDSVAEIDSFVRDTFNRAVKPTVANKGTASAVQRYDDQAASAIQSIVANKANLKFTDETGFEVSGQLPKTLGQFSEAVEQTKRAIFKSYDQMAQQAGQARVKVDVAPLITELNKLRTGVAVQDFSPNVSAYIDSVTERLQARGSYTASEAQEVIQHLNETLQAFYRNPTMEGVSRAAVDGMIVSNLRSALDGAIETAVAPGYQALKNQYGALKTIEKDVVRRAIVTSREPAGGGIIDRLANIGTAAEVVHAITNPKALLSAAAIKGAQMATRYLKSPNRAVTRLFEAAEKRSSAPSASPDYIRPGLPVLGGLVGDTGASIMGLQ